MHQNVQNLEAGVINHDTEAQKKYRFNRNQKTLYDHPGSLISESPEYCPLNYSNADSREPR
jgi:hypothetical protein